MIAYKTNQIKLNIKSCNFKNIPKGLNFNKNTKINFNINFIIYIKLVL